MKYMVSMMALPCCLLACVSCSRSHDEPVPPAIDPVQAAARAFQLYDLDQSGTLNQAELVSCPSLAYALERIDKNQDDAISQNELQMRISDLMSSGTTLIEPIAVVLLDGMPLTNAQIIFEPELFLGEAYKQAQGETDDQGMAAIGGHDSQHPGIYLGFYRVRISRLVKGQESVSEDYNTNSTLGIEAAADAETLIQFSLAKKSKAA